MNRSQSYGTSANTTALRRVFVTRVHQLLELGYRRLNVTSFVAEDEPVITGELARAMNSAIDDDLSPAWVRYFQVQDEEPVNDGTRKGKHRKRIDIGVRSSQSRPRSHFSFEAKSLSLKKRLADYLGSEGLQCFLKAEYAADEQDAGMLGYVQWGTEAEWATNLQKALCEAEMEHRVCDGCFGFEHRFKAGPVHTYLSRHFRPTLGIPIDVFHTFLSFH